MSEESKVTFDTIVEVGDVPDEPPLKLEKDDLETPLKLDVVTMMFVETTVIENPNAKPFLRSFESTSRKSKYQNKFNALFTQIRSKAQELNPDDFYTYFVSNNFTITQNDKTIVLVGKSFQWKHMLFTWIVANDNSLIKYLLKPKDEKSIRSPYEGLPFTHKKLKHILRNLNKIPKNHLVDMRNQMMKMPENMMPDDTAKELYAKLKEMKF